MGKPEDELEDQLVNYAGWIPQTYERQYVFHQPEGDEKKHRWRVDFLWVVEKLALEVEGVVSPRRKSDAGNLSRHTSIGGYMGDIEKYNQLAIQGYSLLRVTPKQVRNREGIWYVVRWFRAYRKRQGLVLPVDVQGPLIAIRGE